MTMVKAKNETVLFFVNHTMAEMSSSEPFDCKAPKLLEGVLYYMDNKFNNMKKVKAILIAVVIGLISCSKSDLVEPIQLWDNPHKKDTTINNTIPHIPLNNQN